MKHKTTTSILSLLLAVVLTFSLFAALVPASAEAASPAELQALEAKRDQLKKQQEMQKQNIAALQKQKAGITEQKQALDAQIALTQQEIALVEAQVGGYNDRIGEKTLELEAAQKEEEAQTKLFRARVRELEENGRLSYVMLLFSSRSLSDLLARIDMIGEILAYDKKLEDDLIAAREAVEQAKQALEDAKAELVATQNELEEKKAALDAQVAEATALFRSLESNIDAYTRMLDDYAAAERAVQQQIDQAIAGQGGGGTIGTGQLAWPCPSTTWVTSPFGWREHPITHKPRLHSGTDIGAAYGSAIVAADGGTVVSASYVGGYGNYLVINHGNGMTTRYAHLSSFTVSPGQQVSKGQTVAYSGNSGGSTTGPHLHFEVTVNGAFVDPMRYF